MPSSIQTINYKNISSSSILLYWDPPEYPNGKITHYTIYAAELGANRAFQMTTSDNSFLITGRMHPFFNFSILMENMHLSVWLTHAVHVLCHSWFWWAAMEILKNMCRNNLIKCVFLYIYQPRNKIIRSQGHRNILNPGNFISETLKYQDWKYWMLGWMTVEIGWSYSADRVLVPNQLYIPYNVPTLFFSLRLLPW